MKNIILYLIATIALSSCVLAIWDDPTELYRQQINFTVEKNYTQFQPKVVLNASVVGGSFNWSNNGNDTRFYLTNGSAIEYYIDEYNATAQTASVFLNFSNMTNYTSVYMYYGDMTKTKTSNGSHVFLLYDDFEDGVAAGWTFNLTAGIGTAAINSSFSHTGNKSAWSNSSAGFSSYRTFSQGSNFIAEAWVWFSGTGDATAIALDHDIKFDGSGAISEIILDSGYPTVSQWGYYDGAGWTTSGCSNGGAGKWTKLRFYQNNTQLYIENLNGCKIWSGVPNVHTPIYFYFERAGLNHVFLDDFFIRSFENVTHEPVYVYGGQEFTGSGGLNYYHVNISNGYNDTPLVGVNVTFYVNGSCLQETANISTSCGGLSTGRYNWTYVSADDYWFDPENLYDGNDATYGQHVCDFPLTCHSDFSINYSKPNLSVGGIWQIVVSNDGITINYTNLTIPTDCFAHNPIQVRDRANGVALFTRSDNYACLNATDWQTLYSADGIGTSGVRLYEEKMYWDMGTFSNLTQTNGVAYMNMASVDTFDWSSYLVGYFNLSGSVNVNSTAYANTSSAVFRNVTVLTRVGNETVPVPYNISTGSKMYTVDGTDQSIWVLNGTQVLSFILAGYYSWNNTYSVNVYDNTTAVLGGVFNAKVNLSSYNLSGHLIDYNMTTFNISVANASFSWSDSCTTTTGWCIFNVSQGYQYNISALPGGFNFETALLNVTSNNTGYNFSHYQKNTINITFYDEETGLKINWTTIILEIVGTYMSDNYSTTGGNITTDVLVPDNYVLRYGALGYNNRLYLITIEDNVHYDLNLTLLNSSTATLVTVTVSDSFGRAQENFMVFVQRYDILTNSYNTVESFNTNFEGKGVISVVLNSEYYKFIVYDDKGNLVYTSSPSYIYTNTVNLVVSLTSTGFQNYFTVNRITGILNFNNNTRLLTFTYADSDGIATQGCILAWRLTGTDKTLNSSSCALGASGTALLTLGDANWTYFIDGVVDKTGANTTRYSIASLLIDLNQKLTDDGLMLFLMAIVMIVIAIMFSFKIELAILVTMAIPLVFILSGLVFISLYYGVALFALGVVATIVVARGAP
jgi:hypothetical protein